MSDKLCADCAGYDIEWMRQCKKHPGVEYCRGCECPLCVEEDDDDDCMLYGEMPLHDPNNEGWPY